MEALPSADKQMKFRIIELESVTSTNDIAMNGLGSAKFAHGDIITAKSQSNGRGQRGNRWVSPAGSNLTFSLVIEPTHIQVCQQFAISMMAALAASQAITNLSGVDCRIKWPNDLYVADRKIGGILIEHTMHSQWLSTSVIGIGINVLQQEFDPALPNPTSIAREISRENSHYISDKERESSLGSTKEVTPRALLEEFCQTFAGLYQTPIRELHSQFMHRLWRSAGYFAYRIPAELTIDKNSIELQARIRSIDPCTGLLTLETREGAVSEHWFKEVEAVL